MRRVVAIGTLATVFWTGSALARGTRVCGGSSEGEFRGAGAPMPSLDLMIKAQQYEKSLNEVRLSALHVENATIQQALYRAQVEAPSHRHRLSGQPPART